MFRSMFGWGSKKSKEEILSSEPMSKKEASNLRDQFNGGCKNSQAWKDVERFHEEEEKLKEVIAERNLYFPNRSIKIKIRSISSGGEHVVSEGNLEGNFDSVNFLLLGASSGKLNGRTSSTLKTLTGSLVFVQTVSKLAQSPVPLDGSFKPKFFDDPIFSLEKFKQSCAIRYRPSVRGSGDLMYWKALEDGVGNFSECSENEKRRVLCSLRLRLQCEVNFYKSLKNDFSEIEVVEKPVSELSFSLSDKGYDYYDIFKPSWIFLTKENLDSILGSCK